MMHVDRPSNYASGQVYVTGAAHLHHCRLHHCLAYLHESCAALAAHAEMIRCVLCDGLAP